VQSDDWSDSDAEGGCPDTNHRIQILEKKLAAATQNLADYRNFISERFQVSPLIEAINESSTTKAPSRDDDSHYFRSYDENG
jgi:protein arginine N-methyltransferase 3